MNKRMVRGFAAGCALALVGTASANFLFGPGPHWVDTVTKGFDQRPSNLLISLFLGDPFDPGTEKIFINFVGNTTIHRSNAMDDSSFFPGLRPIDGHNDVVDIEIVQLTLTGLSPLFGPVIIRAGASQHPLGTPSLGAIAELPGQPALAESFFDVFHEIEIPSLGLFLYNVNPIRMETKDPLTGIPPKENDEYSFNNGNDPFLAEPLFDNPFGFGEPVVWLGEAIHTLKVPAPGSLALLGLAGLFARRRRR